MMGLNHVKSQDTNHDSTVGSATSHPRAEQPSTPTSTCGVSMTPMPLTRLAQRQYMPRHLPSKCTVRRKAVANKHLHCSCTLWFAAFRLTALSCQAITALLCFARNQPGIDNIQNFWPIHPQFPPSDPMDLVQLVHGTW